MNLQAILNQVDAIEDAINKGEFKTISALVCKKYLIDPIRSIIQRLQDAEEVMKYYAEGCHLYTENTDEETTEYIGDYQYGGSVENGFKAKAYLEKYKFID